MRNKQMRKAGRRKKLTAFLLMFGMLAGNVVFSGGNKAEYVEAAGIQTDFINALGVDEMARDKALIYKMSDRRLVTVLCSSDEMELDHYATDYYRTSKDTLISFSGRDPYIGGAYRTKDNEHLFVVTGSDNPSESDTRPCFSISKRSSTDIYSYSPSGTDKEEWIRLGNCNTTVPFSNGSCSMTEYGDYLMIRTSHEMYADSDGKCRDASMMIQYDMKNGVITDYYSGEADPELGFTEQCLNQFVEMDGSKLVALDHGAGYPRALTLYRYDSIEDGTFNKGKSNVSMVEVLPFPGEAGDEYTATYSGGLAVSSSSYLVVASSGLKYSSASLSDPDECRNVFVGVVDKNTLEVTKYWLTDYPTDSQQISAPKIVKISDNSFCVLWSKQNMVYYQKIDGQGRKIGSTYGMNGVLSDCQPTVIDGYIMWYYRNKKDSYFCRINTKDFSDREMIKSGGDVEGVKIDGLPRNGYVHVGETYSLKALTYPGYSESENGWWLSPEIEYFSFDEESGQLTVTAPGYGTIGYRSYYGDDNRTEETVTKLLTACYKMEKMELSDTELIMEVGERKPLTLTIVPEEGTAGYDTGWDNHFSETGGVIFRWNSSTQEVTALNPGKETIIFTARDDYDRKISCDISVYGTEETPQELILKDRTCTSVSFEHVEGEEYSMDLEDWQDSARFTRLDPGTEYSFYVRKKAHGYYHESEPYGPVKVKTQIQVSDVSVSPDEVTVKEEEESVLTLSVLPLSADNRELEWTSEKPEVAIVTKNAEEQTVVRGLKYGETTITGWTQDESLISVSVRVKVLEKEHAWDEGTVVSYGKKKYTCKNCGEEKIETLYSEEWVDGLWYEKNGTQTYKPRLSWHKNSKGWWVNDTSGWYPKNRWQKIDGKWYYFDKEGYMETNAYREKSYLQSNGAWDEKSLVGWKQTSVGWTYQLSGGAKLSGKWAKIDGNWYYFHKNGRMATNEWVNGYWFNANGTWTYKARGSWRKGKEGWWYGDTTGWFAAKGIYTIDGKKYQFDKNGYCLNP